MRDKATFNNAQLHKVILSSFSKSTFAGVFVGLLILLIAVIGILKPFNFATVSQLSSSSIQLPAFAVKANKEEFFKNENGSSEGN